MTNTSAAFCLILSIVGTGCTQDSTVLYKAHSPDGSTDIEVTMFSRLPALGNRLALTLVASGQRTIIKTWENKGFDSFLCFVDTAWTSDSKAVIAVVRDCLHEPAEVLAFDVANKVIIEPGKLTRTLADRIRLDYHLPDTIREPIGWASETVAAKDAFAERRLKTP